MPARQEPDFEPDLVVALAGTVPAVRGDRAAVLARGGQVLTISGRLIADTNGSGPCTARCSARWARQ